MRIISIVLTVAFSICGTAAARERLNPDIIVPELTALGIPVSRLEKRTDPRQLALPYVQDQYYLHFEFGRLTAAQFQQVQNFFHNRSHVAYDAQRVYELTDFLAPSMQALMDSLFEPYLYDTRKLPDPDQSHKGWPKDDVLHWYIYKSGLATFSNCYNTTLEILRQLNPSVSDGRLLIYFPGQWEANDLLRDSRYSEPVSPDDVQPGDVVIFSEEVMMDEPIRMVIHSAIMITNKIIFEKTDGSGNDPYRLSLLEDVKKKLSGNFIEYRRFNGKNMLPLPQPRLPHPFVAPGHRTILHRYFPTLDVDMLHVGCLTGVASGCDRKVNEVFESKVVIDPNSGRGVLSASPKVLKQFSKLKGK